MSLRRFNGWEATETHTHYDAEGNTTGVTVVTREPEWDDEQRSLALARIDYQNGIHGPCGTHLAKALDHTVQRVVEQERFVCLDCEAIEQTRDRYHKRKGHTDTRCDCNKYVFYVSRREPIKSRSLTDLTEGRPHGVT